MRTVVRNVPRMVVTKGELTRERIVNAASALASRVGFDGLTIGGLADELKMSKSGLFAHFGSKEELQLQVLESEVARFEQEVFHPAVKQPRGEARLRAVFDHWLGWNSRSPWPGGCLIVTASVEFDDRPGPLRDAVIDAQKRLLDAVARAAKLAVDAGHLAKGVEPDQLAFEVYGMILSHHFVSRVKGDPRADERARAAFDSLLARNRPR